MASKSKTTKQPSPVVQLLSALWDNRMEGTGHSWQRLNGALAKALSAAIEGGLPFEPGDFAAVYNGFSGGFWFGRDGAHGVGERFYAEAAGCNNLSACQSFEAWQNRPPFIHEGARLFVGAELEIDGKRCTVTSFAEDGQSLVVTRRRWDQEKKSWAKAGVAHVTLESLRKGESARRAARRGPAGPEVHRFLKDDGAGLCKTIKALLKQHVTLKAAWEGAEKSAEEGAEADMPWVVADAMRAVISHMGFEFTGTAGRSAQQADTPAKLREALPWDEYLEPLAAKYRKPKRREAA